MSFEAICVSSHTSTCVLKTLATFFRQVLVQTQVKANYCFNCVSDGTKKYQTLNLFFSRQCSIGELFFAIQYNFRPICQQKVKQTNIKMCNRMRARVKHYHTNSPNLKEFQYIFFKSSHFFISICISMFSLWNLIGQTTCDIFILLTDSEIDSEYFSHFPHFEIFAQQWL